MKNDRGAIIDALILFIFTRCCKLYLSAIERLICRGEMSLIGSTSFGFAQNTMHNFQNTVLNSFLFAFPLIFPFWKGRLLSQIRIPLRQFHESNPK